MAWYQRQIQLPPKARGFHIITRNVQQAIPEITGVAIGIAHVFIQHTSASLTINENADPTVRMDFEDHFNRLVPEDTAMYRHVHEGPDDMTSHIKSSLLGPSLSIPVRNGRLCLGTWQGIYLCEHRDRAAGRNLMITVWGEGG